MILEHVLCLLIFGFVTSELEGLPETENVFQSLMGLNDSFSSYEVKSYS